MFTATALVGLVLGAVVAGPLSDRLGRRPLLVGSSLLFAAAMVVPIVAPVLPAMFLFAVVQGVALGSHLAVLTALLSEVLPGGDDHPGRDLGLVNIVVNLAQVLAPAAAGLIVVATGGYVGLFAFALGAALLSAFCVVRVRSIR